MVDDGRMSAGGGQDQDSHDSGREQLSVVAPPRRAGRHTSTDGRTGNRSWTSSGPRRFGPTTLSGDRRPVGIRRARPLGRVRGGLAGGVPPARRTASGWMTRYLAALIAVDALAAGVAASTAYLVRFGLPHDGDGAHYSAAAAVVLPFAWLAVVAMNRGYEGRFVGAGHTEFERVFRAFLQLTVVLALFSYATHTSIARGYVMIALPLALLLDLLGRYAARKWLHRERRHDRAIHRVLAVGDAAAVLSFVGVLARDRHAGMQVGGACLTGAASPVTRAELTRLGVALLVDVDVEGVVSSAASIDADTVAVVSSSELGSERLRWISWQLEGTGIDLVVSPGIMEVAGRRLHIKPVAGLPLLHVEQPCFRGFRLFLKAGLDRAVAALALVVLLPVLIGIAAAIRLTSNGPALFRQTRVGRDGRTFAMVKFRSMTVDAESLLPALAAQNDSDGVLFKMVDDPRVTRMGRTLRRYSLDELPQLINILAGHMSLVGPRPPLPVEVSQYGTDVRRRLLLRPGLTGLWQVSGRSDLTWEESVRLDLRYVENWSPALDLMILWKTASAVLHRSGAY